jgi:hypothetical protein
MIFSPAYLSALLVKPLRYFFENFAPEDLRWTNDPLTSMIEIDTINNFNKQDIQTKPRILVSRGQYSIDPVGLTDNLAEGVGVYASRGLRKSTNMYFIRGVSQIMIESRNEGTCEKVLDLAQHYLAWSSPLIASTQGFKSLFLPMNISPCVPGKEDTEVFSCTMNLPWMKEEHWQVNSGDEIKVKSFLISLTNEDSA